MSETAKRLFDGLRDGIQHAVKDVVKEVEHQVGRGATELGNGIFQGHGFVLYGSGRENAPAQQQQQSLQQQRDRGMER